MPLLLDSLFSSVALSHFMVDVFNSARPVLLTYLGLTETEIAWISTIYIWASALTQPVFGWLSDRVGPRWLAAGGVLWMTVFFSGAVYIPAAGGLVCLIIAALGSSSFHPVGTTQATLQGRHHRYFSLLHSRANWALPWPDPHGPDPGEVRLALALDSSYYFHSHWILACVSASS
jgi:MFS family permease